MKINVELDVNWIDEDSNLDETIQNRIVSMVSERIKNEFLKETGKEIADRATKIIEAKVDALIDGLLEQPITITEGWNKTTKYDSIYDMVEDQMTALYNAKFKQEKGCTEDPIVKRIKDFVSNDTRNKLVKIESQIKSIGAAQAKKEIENSNIAKALEHLNEN